MPFSRPVISPPTAESIKNNNISNNSVEKSSSVEFKITPRAGKQQLVLAPQTVEINIDGKPASVKINSSVTANHPMSQTSPLFYSPGRAPYSSSPPVRSQSTRSTAGREIHTLPDIGAPDITNEIIRNERRMSGTFLSSSPVSARVSASTTLEHKISSPPLLESGDSSPRPSSKPVFYTHSMKKKSTEPKFV